MIYKKLILLSIVVILIYAGYNSPYGNYWLGTYILTPNNSFVDQWDKTSIKEREEFRYGNLYTLSNLIKNTISSNKINPDSSLVLFPPFEYLKARNVSAFAMPDPSSFYCLTRIRSVWITSPNVKKSNWVIVPNGKNTLSFKPITSESYRNQLLDSFSKYTPSL